MKSSVKKEVRTRIAPSPTGFFHVGTARTALFNYLYAKRYGGEFILRIEDTDKERSKPEYEEDIIRSLEWLGLEWDSDQHEGHEQNTNNANISRFYRQSERTEIYKKYLEKLLNEGKAYYCCCAKEELEAQRISQETNGHIFKYSGKCRQDADIRGLQRRSTQNLVIRFKVPEKKVLFHDEIRGKVEFDSELFGDIVIAKSLDEPLYNFTVVVDDEEMEITHVIRGEDHLGNTPKQILLQAALGFREPHYAHLPLILAPDRSKLSKRAEEIDATIKSLRERGYLPEAVVNFLALLGWSPGDNREIFSLEELEKFFDLKKIQKGGAIFNIQKLDWFGAHYIQKLKFEELKEKMWEFIPDIWKKNPEVLDRAIGLEQERMKTLRDFEEAAGFFFELPEYPAERLVWKNSDMETARKRLEHVLDIMEESLGDGLETRVMEYAEKEGRGDVLWPLRVALSGLEKSPGPFQIIKVIGREEGIQRIKHALNKISPPEADQP
ncbi:MAG: glutamate--tRNA ligase [Nanoarchaeota archaeon]|nr:glutamate--tRNA ligase [Nanoarchaeota archaeon]